MKVFALSLYPSSIASTRLRVSYLEGALAEGGITLEIHSAISDKRVAPWLRGGWHRIPSFLAMPWRTWKAIRRSRGSDVVVVQREFLPFATLALERHLKARGARLVWDVDDILWSGRSSLAGLLRGGVPKYKRLAQLADEVWVGNRYLQRLVSDWTKAPVVHAPTVVEWPEQVDNSRRLRDVLVWIGTPSTSLFLQQLLNECPGLLDRWRLIVIGADKLQFSKPSRVLQLPWSEANENWALSRGSIGLYPLDTSHPLVPGKSALKSVLYAANGLPVVATPTEATRDRLEENQGAFFATTAEEWLAALDRLASDAVRFEQQERGREMAKQFSVQAWASWLAGRLLGLAADEQDVWAKEGRPNHHEGGPVGVRARRLKLTLVWGIDSGLGGSERRMLEVIPRFHQLGVQIDSIHLGTDQGELVAQMADVGARVLSIPSWWRLPAELRARNPDVVWAFGDRAAFACATSRRLTSRGHKFELWTAQNIVERTSWGLRRLIARLSRSQIGLVIANSESARLHAINDLHYPASSVGMILPSLGDAWLEGAIAGKDWEFRRKNLLMVANNSPRKQMSLGLEVLEKLPKEVSLTIFTDRPGDLPTVIEQKRLTSRVSLVIGHKMVPSDYREYGALLHFSNAESAPRVMLEARSQGCEVVAFDVADVALYATRVVPLDDVSAFVAKTKEICFDSAPPQSHFAFLTTRQYAEEVVSLAALPEEAVDEVLAQVHSKKQLLNASGKSLRVVEVVRGFGRGGAEIALGSRLSAAPSAAESLVIATTRATSDVENIFQMNNVETKVLQSRFGKTRALARMIDEFNADVVISHSPLDTIRLAMFKSVTSMRPLVAVAHNEISSEYRFKALLLSAALRWMNPRVDMHIAVSEPAKSGAQCVGSRRSRVVLLGGRATSARNEGSHVTQLWPSETQLKLLCLGRASPQKNLHTLVEAAHQLSHSFREAGAHISLVGLETGDDSLRRYVAQLGMESQISCHEWSNATESWLDSADILLVPSKHEGGPLAAYEALLRGTQVVGSSVGAVSQVVSASGGVALGKGSLSDVRRLLEVALFLGPTSSKERELIKQSSRNLDASSRSKLFTDLVQQQVLITR